jgi:hypothetical protein
MRRGGRGRRPGVLAPAAGLAIGSAVHGHAWLAVVALVVVVVAGVAVRGGAPVLPDGVRRVAEALRAVSRAAAKETGPPTEPELPDDEMLKPVTEAVRALLAVFGTGQRLTANG